MSIKASRFITKGLGNNLKVIISTMETIAFMIRFGNRDGISTLKHVGIAGCTLTPFGVFQGKRFSKAWLDYMISSGMVLP